MLWVFILFLGMKIIHEFYFYAIYKIYCKIFGTRWAYVNSTSLVRAISSIGIFHLMFIFLILRKITPKIYFIEIIFWIIILLLEFLYAKKNLWGDKYIQVIEKLDIIKKNKGYWPFVLIYLIGPALFFLYLLLPKLST